MPRTTYSPDRKRRHNKLLKGVKGYWGARGRLYKRGRETLERALVFAYRDRRVRKRTSAGCGSSGFNAAARVHDLSYSQLMRGLKSARVELNRKVLADLAVQDSAAFARLVTLAKEHL